ncbi:MAG: hypothetical protein U0441_04930 [Polyangiaceae bacterium]
MASPFVLAGCDESSVDGVCDEWDGRGCAGWSGVAACRSAGRALQDTADQAGCHEELQRYLDCVRTSESCQWGAVCATPKQELISCQGSSF